MAFVQKSALATGTTTVTPVLTGTVAGNILWAFVTGNQASALGSFTCSDGAWSQIAAAATATTIVRAEIWSKIAVGSDTMPQWGNNSTLMDCSVVEWSGQTTLDKTGTDTGVLSPETVTAAGTDGGTGRVIIVLAAERQTAAATETFTWNVNSLGVGTGINTINNSGASSQAKHSNSIYVTTATTGSSADNGVATWNNVSTGAALVLASYYQGAIAISGSIGASGGVSAVNKQVMANAAAIGASAGIAVPAVGPSSTPTRVQAFGNSAGAGSVNASGAAVGSGNLLVVAGSSASAPSISDTLSLSWNVLPVSGGSAENAAWYAVVGIGGAETVTITGGGDCAVSVLEITGQNATPIDVQSSSHGIGSGTATANSSATGSPTSANEIAVGMIATILSGGTTSITARAFSPSLTSHSDETVQGPGTAANVTAISDGPLASASAETFTATLAGTIAIGWSAWCLLIQGAGGTGQTGNYETVALNGTISANGTVTGTIPPQSTAIIGAISANGALAGLNKEAAAVVAAISANASVAGLNTESVQVAGSIGANGSVAGTDTTVITLAGSIAANGAMAAVDTKAIALSGAIGANGALAGVPTETAPLIGAIAANGALSGTAVNTLLAVGSVNANAGMAATNTEAVALNGVVAANGAVAGGEKAATALTGSISANGAVAGNVINSLFIAGAIAANGAMAGTNTEKAAITGAIAANGAVAGNLTKSAPLAGSISANGAMAGLNTVAAQLQAAIAASAAMQAGNTQAVALLGLIAANGAVQGTITFPTQPLVGVIGAMSGMGGLLTSSFNVGVFTTALLWVTSCNGALEVGGRDGILAPTGADGNVRVNGRDGLLNVTSADGPVRTQEVH